MELQVGVKALLKNKSGKYLLVHRSLDKYPEVEKRRWDIVGGRIDPGQTLLENLKREIKEETNLDLIDEPKLIAAQDILRLKNKHIVRLTYLGFIEGEVRLDDDHDKHGWFTLEEIKRFVQSETLDMYVTELINDGLIDRNYLDHSDINS